MVRGKKKISLTQPLLLWRQELSLLLSETGERLNDSASATWIREAELLSPIEAEEAVGEVAGGQTRSREADKQGVGRWGSGVAEVQRKTPTLRCGGLRAGEIWACRENTTKHNAHRHNVIIIKQETYV